MSPRATPPAFPEALDDDDDDVTWALETAAVQWKRGALEDAVEWVYRAVESAVDGGRTIRARQLQKQVNALETALRGGYRPGKDSGETESSSSDGESNGGLTDADLSTELLEPDAYMEVSIDSDADPTEPTGPPRGLHAAARQSHLTETEELLLDDADVVDEGEDPAGEPIALVKSRPPNSARSPNSLRSPNSPNSLRSQSSARSPTSVRGVRRFRLDPEPVTEPLPKAKPARLPGSNLKSDSVPGSDAPTSSAPISLPLDSVPGHGEDGPTARSMDLAPAPESSSLPGQLLSFGDPLSDETTTRQAVSLPSELSPSTRERETLPDSEPRTSRDPSQPGPPESGPPTEPPFDASSSTARGAPLSQPTRPAAPSVSPEPPLLGSVLLSDVPGLEDLPDESQQSLVRTADIHTLATNEEVGAFSLALVLFGSVSVMPAVADYAAARVTPGNLVFSQGHLENGVALRVVAGADGAEVATWDGGEFEKAIAECPWVGDDLRVVGDRFQALAGVTMGKMGEQLDDMLRALIVERCEVRRLLPGEVVVEIGRPIPGMVVVGAGRLELVQISSEREQLLDELAPGDFLFASEILQGTSAPATARAGKNGALVLFADRNVTHELLVSVPPLLGIFAP